jgi:uncharacterized protein
LTVYLVDSSVWIALALSGHDHHGSASDWLSTVTEPSSLHFCRATQQSFLRLLTQSAVFARFGDPPLTNHQAWNAYEAFLVDERVSFQSREPQGLEVRWRHYSARGSASPRLWMDAYLAAFALAGGYQMVTIDAAFAQFDGLDLVVLGSSGN